MILQQNINLTNGSFRWVAPSYVKTIKSIAFTAKKSINSIVAVSINGAAINNYPIINNIEQSPKITLKLLLNNVDIELDNNSIIDITLLTHSVLFENRDINMIVEWN